MGRKLRLDEGFPVRLRAFFDALGKSDRKIAQSLGITPAAVSSALGGRSYLAPENLGKLHSLYRLNVNWLLSGHGEMFADGPSAEASSAGVAGPAYADHSHAGAGGVDQVILMECIKAVEEALRDTRRVMDPDKKAEVIAALYDLCVEAGGKAVPASNLLPFLKASGI